MKAKPLITIGLVATGCHFLACLLIVPLTLYAGDAVLSEQLRSVVLGFLHRLTRILYYPIIGLALYPRHWFPGPWMNVPILANSMLWGAVAAMLAIGWRRLRGRA